MEVSGQLHAPAALSPGKSPWYPLDRRLGWPQSRSGRGDEEKNSQTQPGHEPLIVQPVAQCCTTELSRLLVVIIAKFVFSGTLRPEFEELRTRLEPCHLKMCP
jgi:hypothetical protein